MKASLALYFSLMQYSKDAAVEKSLQMEYEDISKVASLIESRLVACYLRLKRPEIALNHSHR